MKQLFSNLALLLLVAIVFPGCKKDKRSEPDFGTLFKNTEWTGEIKYSNKPLAEPFSVEFSANGTFQWHELSGNYAGSYTVNTGNRETTLQFTGASNAQFTATITHDNKFSNIVLAGTYPWTIIGCELNNSGKQQLDNTTWAGKFNTGVNIEIKFMPGEKIQYKDSYFTLPYQRTGTAIRFVTSGTDHHLLVLQPDNKSIKGFYLWYPSPYYSYKLTRQ